MSVSNQCSPCAVLFRKNKIIMYASLTQPSIISNRTREVDEGKSTAPKWRTGRSTGATAPIAFRLNTGLYLREIACRFQTYPEQQIMGGKNTPY
jgi:hypothetical protein